MPVLTKETHLEQIENALKKHLQSNVPSLQEAAEYIFTTGGKRLRPLLTLTTVEALNGNLNCALTPACAIEMIHTYSLIHDDLPCMDNDDFRRGKPTLHKVYNEAHAVLTGDYLLTLAFEMIANEPLLTPTQKVSLISTLAKASGGQGMIAGQVMDVENENTHPSIDTLKNIHAHKTGALITSAIEFGAIICNVSKEHRAALKSFAEKIGLAFQIIDDVLDVTNSVEKHGKKTASDQTNNKSTYTTLLGIDEAKHQADELYKSALNDLKNLPQDTSLLNILAEKCIYRSK